MSKQEIELTVIVVPVGYLLSLVSCDLVQDAHVRGAVSLLAQEACQFLQLLAMVLIQTVKVDTLKKFISKKL